ncbi:uncharacterized protein LOC134248091 [Saccostrea cucullata]|uniref:uncharacterized protein LOC134248091 n=1 Tax=Saccostrea cuccullata TaxID=36930 RepID=UPI002ED4755E
MPPKKKRPKSTTTGNTPSSETSGPAKRRKQTTSASVDIAEQVNNAIQLALPKITQAVLSAMNDKSEEHTVKAPEVPQELPSTSTEPLSQASDGTRIQGGVPIYESNADTNISNNAQPLKNLADFILQSSLSKASRSSYDRAFTCYKSFMFNQYPNVPILPPSSQHVALFVAFCFQSNMATSTLKSYLSALGYIFKLKGYQDVTQLFVIRKMLQGYEKLKPGTGDTRLPITPSILRNLVDSLDHLGISFYQRSMLKSMYLLAFHAFLRVGEITITSRHHRGNVLLLENVKLVRDESNTLEGLEIRPDSFKHSSGRHIPTLFLQASNSDEGLCPVQALLSFITLRGQVMGPLFSYPDGHGIQRQQFTNFLQMSLKWSGLDSKLYKTHSFRIGAATSAAEMGISDEKIKQMGRWHSDAYKKYIRIPVLKI